MHNETSFLEFCNGFGLRSYPFSSYTAEDEKEKLSKLFVKTNDYSPILQSFVNGSTLILCGDRGTGKTSVIYDFIRQAGPHQLVCQIDDFSTLREGYSDSDFYKFILSKMVNTFFCEIHRIKKPIRRISDNENLLLTFFFVNFASDATRGFAARIARDIQVNRKRRFIQSVYNFFRLPLNVISSFGVSIIAEIIARSSGSSTNLSATVSEFFPEVTEAVMSEFPAADSTLEAMNRFSSLAQTCGFSKISVIIDKIDEDVRFANAAEDISEYMLPILKNNNFLFNTSFQVVFSTWVVPFNFIRDQVRTQKLHNCQIVWEHSDLVQVYLKRTGVFSGGTGLSFEATFERDVGENLRTDVLDLCNGNPRDLWHLMDKIFRAQYRLNPKATKIGSESIVIGMKDFVEKFNFYEYYPRKANARANSMDVYAYIKHLLKLDGAIFTRNQLNEKAGTGSSTQNYTVGMENLGLIEKNSSEKGETTYRIRDPKIRYAQKNNIELSKTI